MKLLIKSMCILCTLLFCSCFQNQKDNIDFGDLEVDGYYFSNEEYKFGTIINNSSEELNVKVYSYAYGFFKSPCDKVYEVIVKPGEQSELKNHYASGDVSGYTVMIEINNWKGAGWFCEDSGIECIHDVDGIWYKNVQHYSNYIRNKDSGELVPCMLDEIRITVSETNQISIDIIPYEES